MDYGSLLFCLGAFLIACLLDISSSMEMTRHGIREGTRIIRDSNGNFSLPKALIFVAVPVAVVVLVFVFVPQNTVGYDRVYAPLVLLPGAALHLWAYFQNKKLIEAKKVSTVRGGVL